MPLINSLNEDVLFIYWYLFLGNTSVKQTTFFLAPATCYWSRQFISVEFFFYQILISILIKRGRL